MALSPSELDWKKLPHIPNKILECFNDALKNSVKHRHIRKDKKGAIIITLYQKNMIATIQKKLSVSENDIFQNHWLDIERHYRQAGWIVKNKFSYWYAEQYWTFAVPERCVLPPQIVS